MVYHTAILIYNFIKMSLPSQSLANRSVTITICLTSLNFEHKKNADIILANSTINQKLSSKTVSKEDFVTFSDIVNPSNP